MAHVAFAMLRSLSQHHGSHCPAREGLIPMNLILVAVLLTGSPETAPPRQAHAVLAPQVQTGTLIVSKGDCLAIKIYSASGYTHVAAVVVDEEAISVYESTGGAG